MAMALRGEQRRPREEQEEAQGGQERPRAQGGQDRPRETGEAQSPGETGEIQRPRGGPTVRTQKPNLFATVPTVRTQKPNLFSTCRTVQKLFFVFPIPVFVLFVILCDFVFFQKAV